MKPRCGEFHRQFSPIPGNLPELESAPDRAGHARRASLPTAKPTSKYAPPGPEANQTRAGRLLPASAALHRIFPFLLEIQQINPL